MFRKSFLLMAVVVIAIGCDTTKDTSSPPALNKGAETGHEHTVDTGSKTTAEATTSADAADVNEAICNLIPIGNSGVSGTVHFVREGGTVEVHGEVTGLTPGKHGFHVHESGDLSDKETGKSTGGHFNPEHKDHGKPSDSVRHVGDLGNIEADQDGKATIEIKDTLIALHGKDSIIGRGLVIHAGEDQFTQPTGDAGDRVAFGVIEQVKEQATP